MEYGAIDLHSRNSLIRIVEVDGAVVLDRTVATTREGFTRVFGERAAMRVLLESGTESAWVATLLEALGHEVVVADPNYALMYGARGRAVKTDRRDVAALAEACRLGVYRRAHRVSAAQREVRRRLRVREQLVRMRTQAINLLRAQVRQEGYRLRSGASETASRRCRELALPAAVADALAPVLALLDALGPLLRERDRDAQQRAAADPIVRRLMTAPGVGPIVGLTYRAVLDDVERFADANSARRIWGWSRGKTAPGRGIGKARSRKPGPRRYAWP